MRSPVPRLGHAVLDRQHLRLVASILAVRAAVRHGSSARALMTALIRDTRRHFVTEDRLMRSTAYPDQAGHAALHDGIVREMLQLRHGMVVGPPPHPWQIDQILSRLAQHCGEADRNVVEHLRRV